MTVGANFVLGSVVEMSSRTAVKNTDFGHEKTIWKINAECSSEVGNAYIFLRLPLARSALKIACWKWTVVQ